MTLSKYKGLLKDPATKRFTDRETAQAAFNRLFASITHGTASLRVLTFYGAGGIGKSALIHELKENIPRHGVRLASVDCENPLLRSPIDLLLEIRRQLGIPCYRFEYAVARALQLSGEELRNLNKSLLGENSLLLDAIDVAAEAVGVIPVFKLFRKLAGRANAFVRQHLTSLREEFETIDLLSEEDLVMKVPFYLADDIARGLLLTDAHAVLFLDSFEALHKRQQFNSTKQRLDAWVQELIGASERSLFVIGSREFIRWSEWNPEWDEVLEQHLLGALARADAEQYLTGIPVLEPDIRDAIISVSAGVPLYLDLCASTYLIEKANGSAVKAADFALHQGDVIDRFLSHLDQGMRHAARAIALVVKFDSELFAAIVRNLNLPVPLSLFDEFCAISYSDVVDAQLGLYAMQSTFAMHLAARPMSVILAGVVRSLQEQLMESREHGNDAQRQMWLTEAYMSLLRRFPLHAADDQRARWEPVVETLLDGIEAGRWIWVAGVLESYLAGRFSGSVAVGPSKIDLRLLLLQAYCFRKEGRLEEASRSYARLAEFEDRLQDWRPLYRYLSAHTAHLLGNYGAAAAVYVDIANIAANGALGASNRCAARRQLGDIEMIRGRFREADAIFDEALRERRDDSIWVAECWRFKGHNRRFNHLHEAALGCYGSALDTAEAASCEAMIAKALTNRVETLCWRAPQEALDLALSAVQANEAVGAPIEAGKALAAMAISELMLDRISDALATAARALQVQDRAGYRAGRLFALQAVALVHWRRGEERLLDCLLSQMQAEAENMGVYAHLVACTKYICGRHGIRELEHAAQWLEFESTLEFLDAKRQQLQG